MRFHTNQRPYIHFIDRIRKHVSDQGQKTAIINETGKTISYSELYNSASALASNLKHSSNKSIALLCRDPINMAIGLLGTWLNNSTAVPLHHSYPFEEIEYRLNLCSSDLVLHDNSHSKSICMIQFTDIREMTKINTQSGVKSLKPLWSSDDPALILFTSGTTGKPKGVVHTFNSLFHQLSDIQESWEMRKDDRFFVSLPLNHIHGLVTGLLSGLWAGAEIVLHSNFDPEMAWSVLADPRTTFFTAVPVVYSKLLNYFRAHRLRGNLNHFRLMVSGSSSLNERLLADWTTEIRKEGIMERYGMTETGMIATNPINRVYPGVVGKPFPSVEINIEKEKFDDQFGQVYVRGLGLFKGYLMESNEGPIFSPRDPNKFFRTGDQGIFSENGYLRLVGRDRDIIKVNGFKVGSGEIELAILGYPGVSECSVIGLDDQRDPNNQVISALIVSNNCDFCTNSLKRFLSEKLTYYKVPRKIQVISAPLPRNIVGKLDHAEILNLMISNKSISN